MAGGGFGSKPAVAGVSRFQVRLPDGVRMPSGLAAPQMAISPDGRNLVFAAGAPGGKSYLWIRSLDSFATQRLARTDGAEFPFWSPEGQNVGFFADNKLKKIALSGGSPQSICDAQSRSGGTWNREGMIVFGGSAGLMRVSSAGGSPAPATLLDQGRGEVSHMWPQFLPDGKHFLYLVRNSTPEKDGIYVQALGAAEKTLVLATSVRALYTPPGYLLFVREGTLFAKRMHPNRFQLSGEPLPVAADATATERTGRAGFTVSGNGVLVYRSSVGVTGKRLAWYDRDGKRIGLVGEPADYDQIALSPDEKRLAVARPEKLGAASLWVIDLAGEISTRLTFDAQDRIGYPVWSADSHRIAFHNLKNGGMEEILLATGARTVLTRGSAIPQDWSPDGRLLAFIDSDSKKLSLLDFLSERKPLAIIETPYEFSEACFSPDGRRIAYTSKQSGREEVYIASMPSFTDKRQVSSEGGRRPIWRRDAAELYFIAPGGKLMAAEIKPGNGLDPILTKPLFSIVASSTGLQYAVADNGRKFLINEIPQTDDEQLNVVLNWTADLKH
jgi:Tol biopolymer transport system component